MTYCYGYEITHLWYEEISFRSETGVQQGDPLSSLMFGLALQAPLLRLHEKIKRLESGNLEESKESLMVRLYLDDGVIIGKHHVLHTVLEFFQSEEAVESGLHLLTSHFQSAKYGGPARHKGSFN